MQKEFGLLLLECSDYREFLRLHFNPPHGVMLKPAWSYELFARKAGFASKSYIHHVIHGRKNLSMDSAEKVIQALKLTKLWSEFFRALIKNDSAKLKSISIRLKKHLSIRQIDPGIKKLSSSVMQLLPLVYASLGEANAGASLAEIRKRCKLADAELRKTLNAMLDVGMITKCDERYKVNASHLDVIGLGGTTQFKADFKFSVERAIKRVAQGQTNKAAFYLNTFSVHAADLPKFSRALKELLAEFAVDSEDATGDCVAELICSFSSNVDE